MKNIPLTNKWLKCFVPDCWMFAVFSAVLWITGCYTGVQSSPSGDNLLTTYDRETNAVFVAKGNIVRREMAPPGVPETYEFQANVTLLEIVRINETSAHIFACLNRSTSISSCSITNIETKETNEISIQVKDERISNILISNALRTNMFRLVAQSDVFYLSATRDVGSNTNHMYRVAVVLFEINVTSHSMSALHAVKVSSTFTLEILHETYFNSSLFYLAKSLNHTAFEPSHMLIYLNIETGQSIQSNVDCFGEPEVMSATHYSYDNDTASSMISLHRGSNGLVLCGLLLAEICSYFRELEKVSRHKITINQRYCSNNVYIKNCISTPIDNLAVTTLFFRQITPFFQTDSETEDLTVTREAGNILAHILLANSKITTVKMYNNSQILYETLVSGRDGASSMPGGLITYGNKLYALDGKNGAQLIDVSNCGRHVAYDVCLRDVAGCANCREQRDNTSTAFTIGGEQVYCQSSEVCSAPVHINETTFVQPEVVAPLWGPAVGGNLLTVTGDQLDLIQNITVTIGDKPCDILEETVTRLRLLCAVPRYDGDVPVTVVVTIHLDGTAYQQNGGYEYIANPVISSYHPKYTIESGGTMIALTSTSFTERNWENLSLVVLDPTLSLTKRRFPCSRFIAGISCILPPVRRVSSNTNVSLGLSLGATGDVLPGKGVINNLSITVEVRSDPIIRDFYGWRISPNQEEFVIEGKNLGHVEPSEISVYGLYSPSKFNISYINNTDIIFFVEPTDYIILKVTIGEHLVFYPGNVFAPETTLSSTSSSTTTSMTPTIPRTPLPTTPPSTRAATTVKRHESPLQTGSGDSIAFIVTASVFACLLAIVIVGFLVRRFLKRRNNKRFKQQRPSIVSFHSSMGVVIGDRMPSRSLSNASLSDGLLTEGVDDISKAIIKRLESEDLIIKRANLSLNKLIGRGNFGSVFRGVIQNQGEEPIDVAVKTLHQDEPRNIDIQLFLKEAYVMKDFQHENVMTLVGICLDLDEMPLVILPYMEHGDLLSYLHEDKHIPTVKDLVSFGLDIAKGMTYLAQLKFVHRDLAARNCMLDSNYTVKVADFGLSRDIYESSYYSARSKGTKLPVKWMAIDSLSNGVFNEKTDVWSFGVTLWELMTRGVRPYATVDNWDMERYLNSGLRLPQPMFCPNQLYKVIRKCWSADPEDRPSFAELQAWISEMLERVHLQLGDTDKTTNIQQTYVNLSMGASYYYENEAAFNTKAQQSLDNAGNNTHGDQSDQ